MINYAHSENIYGIRESVYDHVCETAKLASYYGSFLDIKKEAEAAAWLHDGGKNSCIFQEVLSHKRIHVDHAAPGVYYSKKFYNVKGLMIAIAIDGHHKGLNSGSPKVMDRLCGTLKAGVKSDNGMEYSLTGDSIVTDAFDELFSERDILPDELECDWMPLYKAKQIIAAMLYQRMLFSVLVDADYTATDAHFTRKTQEYTYESECYIDKKMADQMLNCLIDYRTMVKMKSSAAEGLNAIRDVLYDYCSQAAAKPRGAFTLTSPTGTGKTLAMLAFALEHIRNNQNNRIIVVLPYLNLIDQTVDIYRKIFKDSGIVYEDHSMAHENRESDGNFYVERWNSPVIITTTVRFFEALFENSAPDCRKLHHIANSVILFDEAQSMPPSLAAPTLSALAYLCDRFGSTVVFSTATQPAFEFMKGSDNELEKWKPEEIIPNSKSFYNKCRRVNVEWRIDRQTSFDKIAEEASAVRQCCIIVNNKRHALEMFNKLKKYDLDEVYHISTNMCPAHRIDVLNEIKQRLEQDLPCHVVSTQCIEAGVDLDFSKLFRSIAPLDAIIQAAGRCNRKGNPDMGSVVVFIPENDGIRDYPSATYQEFTTNVILMLHENNGFLDIYSTETINQYYKNCFKDKEGKHALLDAIESLDYSETSEQYVWIEERPDVSIIVPYEKEMDLYNELLNEARDEGINGKWISKARKLSVNVSINKKAELVDVVENTKYASKKGKPGEGSDWYILLNNEAYNQGYGLDFDKGYFANYIA